MQVVDQLLPDPLVAGRFFTGPDEGPFVMVNLLRFRDRAEYHDGSDTHLSGREAYDRYAEGVRPLIEALGGRVVYSGAVTGLLLGEVEDLWDAVGLVEYPSLGAFRDMALSPEMRAIEHHRMAGLAGQLNIRTRPQ
ncbi:MAG: DUF1330 domain-containing protein [Ilumatobacteraceae bacterium]|nr:DUF1330 domain-containing protein [Acidimicrobiales bacterium]MCB9393326.1 DUF1330 domain-containing protein [Acidimicrobiaceae bacterium]